MRLPVVLGLLLSVMTPAAQQPAVRVTSHGVRLQVIVTSGGKPMMGLTAADFEVVDSGVRQEVDAVAAVGQVSLAVVLDVSLSVRVPGHDRMFEGAADLLSALDDGEQGTIVAFSDRVYQLTPVTVDRSALRVGLDRARTLGAGVVPRSTVWDAVVTGGFSLRRATSLPWVVLFSDGMDNASGLSREEVEEALARESTTVDLVKLQWDRSSFDRFGPGPQTPELLATRSGGREYSATDRRLGEQLKSRLKELRHAYVLTYQPRGVKTGDGWHDISVRVPSRNATVRTRPGYFAAASGS